MIKAIILVSFVVFATAGTYFYNIYQSKKENPTVEPTASTPQVETAETTPILSFWFNGVETKFSYSRMKAELIPHELSVKNPAYNKEEMSYEGINPLDLFRFVGFQAENLASHYLVLTCADGYRPVIDGAVFQKNVSLLAYKEKGKEFGTWRPAKQGDKMVDPGPLFLVWGNPDAEGASWPYQIVEMRLVDKKEWDTQEKVLVPAGVATAESQRGYKLFREHCYVCHSVRYVGPKGMAPDIAGVTWYRSDDEIKATIKAGKGKMTPFADKLNETDLNDLVAYLKGKGAE
jgi:mono/diheme cytochrome c family protein